jgi:hypothetical protein
MANIDRTERDDAETAAATARVHAWFREHLELVTNPRVDPPKTTRPGPSDPNFAGRTLYSPSLKPPPARKDARYEERPASNLMTRRGTPNRDGRPHSPACGRNGEAGGKFDPEAKRIARNAAQNASRAAKRSADLYTCQDCHLPTGRRAGAFRCYRCDRVHKCVVRNANRAEKKAKEAGK